MTEKEMQEKKRNLIEKIEKLRERDKKKDKLLELYRKWVGTCFYGRFCPYKELRKLIDEIKALEEELE